MVKTLLEAIQNECVPQFMEQHKDERVELTSTRIDMSARNDGKRTRIEGLKTHAVQNCDKVELWRNVDFVDCEIHSASEVSFENCRFFRGQWYQELSCIAQFEDCEFDDETKFYVHSVTTSRCRFSDIEITPKPTLSWRDNESIFDRCRLNDSSAADGSYSGTKFSRCELRVRKWNKVRFSRVWFINCSFQSQTVFEQCDWESLEVDRDFVDSLGPTRGGISDNEFRRYFKVVDSITDLRLAFGGWRRLLHITTILLFAAPYIGHMGKKLIESWMSDSAETESLAWSLARYGLFGNKDHFNAGTLISVVTAIVFFAYNAARAVLLVKSRNLEHQHEIQGIWPQFSIEDSVFGSKSNRPPKWRHLLTFVNYIAYLALASAAWHFLKLLSTRVPV